MPRLVWSACLIVVALAVMAVLAGGLARNTASLSMLNLALKGESAAELQIGLELIPAARRLQGAAAVRVGDMESGQSALVDAVRRSSPSEPNDWVAHGLLGQISYRRGDALLAGREFERAGLLDMIPMIKTSPALRAGVGVTRLLMLEESTLALALDAADRQDFANALKYAKLVERLSDNVHTNAHVHYLYARVLAHEGKYASAVIEARQSLDIRPQADASDDERMQFMSTAASLYVLEHDCSARGDALILYSLAVHRPDRHVLPDDCYRTLITSTLDLLPDHDRPYLLLGAALSSDDEGEPGLLAQQLDAAERLGLPGVWSQVLLGDAAGDVWTRVAPGFVLDDAQISGYEVSPLQLELGLPVDLILFNRTNDRRGWRLSRYRTTNLMPDPGFEFGALARQYAIPYIPAVFRDDIYGAPITTGRDMGVRRPYLPADDTDTYATSALNLSNLALLNGKSGLTTYYRPTQGDAHFLHAGWIKSQMGNGYIGRSWNTTLVDPPYNYLLAEVSGGAWQHASQVIKPPADATGTELWLLNFDSRGDVLFDSVLFVKLP